MATIPFAHLTITAGATPGGVIVALRGVLDAPAAERLRTVIEGILDDRDILSISLDLHDVRGIGVGGISGLAATADRADERGAELTLTDPPERLCAALESEGLTGLVRIVHQDRRPPWLATDVDRRQARRRHPSGHPLLVAGPDIDRANGT